MKAKVHITLKNGVLDPQGKAVQHALGSLGFERTDAQLDNLGWGTLALKHRIKRTLGFSLSGMRLPRRFFETESAQGKLDPGVLREAMNLYAARLDTLLSDPRFAERDLVAAG